jgi:hypothetical protein
MATINSWANVISSAAVTLNGGAVNIGSDNAANAINIGVGTTARTVGICNSAAAHTLTVGSSNGAAATTIQYGTAGLSVTGGSGGQSMAITSAGQVTVPLQPVFDAYLGSGVTDVTGDGTVYTVIFDTELTDIGSNYDNTTGIFTAPVTGKYFFTSSVQATGIGAHTSAQILIVTTPKSFQGMLINPAASAGGQLNIIGSCVVSLTASDTVKITVTFSGSTKTVDIAGSSSPTTYFSGYLIA